MKRILFATFAALVALTAQPQVIVNLNNNISGCVRSPVYGPEPGNPILSKTGNTATGIPPGVTAYSGSPLSGANYRAQLFYAPGFVSDPALLLWSGGPIGTFRSGSLSGYITNTPVIAGLPPGSSATFQVRAWDSSGGTYSSWEVAEIPWLLGNIAAGKSPLVHISSLAASNNLCGLLSFNIYYYPPASPVIFSGPTNQTVYPGQDATFTVSAAGFLPLAYQWRFNSTPIPGATNSSCTISNAQLTNAGPYDVVVTNAAGSVTSAVATLTLIVLPDIGVLVDGTNLVDAVSSVSFGTIQLGQTNPALTFTVTNAGQKDLSLGPVSLTGGAAGDYLLDTSSLVTRVAPGASTALSVAFRPTGDGLRDATLRIASDDPDESPFDIALTGTLIRADSAFTPIANGLVFGLAVQPDNKVLLGGTSRR